MSPDTIRTKTVSKVDKRKRIKINKGKLIKCMKRANKWVRDLEYFCDFGSEDGLEVYRTDEEDVNNDEDYIHKNKEKKISTNSEVDEEPVVKKLTVRKRKLPGEKPIIDVKKRLRGMNEIKEKLNEIKGMKMSSILETRYKKNLKTRLTKHQKKEKRKLEKLGKNKNKLIKQDTKRPRFDNGEPLTDPDKNIKYKEEESKNIEFNKEGKMVFNRFDFSGVGKKDRRKINKVDKDPKLILEKVQKRKAELLELEKAGEEGKAKMLKEKHMWATMLKKAEGIKVKDDAELLKKTIRRDKQMKNRRQRKWDDRVKTIEKKKEERQKKRMENIAAKKKEHKKKKIQRSVKKGRIVI